MFGIDIMSLCLCLLMNDMNVGFAKHMRCMYTQGRAWRSYETMFVLRDSAVRGVFNVSKLYDLLCPKFKAVSWAKIIWSDTVVPRHRFISALAMQSKLATIDNGTLNWLKMWDRSNDLWKKVAWCEKRKHRRHLKWQWFVCSMGAVIYAIWQERNSRIFADKESDVCNVLKRVKILVNVRLLAKYMDLEEEILENVNA
ncbi:hypothetical protein RND81_05G043100 [Saponaria officinalis]|uniref:Reverse transcriptase zinc-binding domain-containing protein n=1 Tax=Saponaria officinalis TaxID=3572 RepID=A0AAW1KU66_SAPOF